MFGGGPHTLGEVRRLAEDQLLGAFLFERVIRVLNKASSQGGTDGPYGQRCAFRKFGGVRNGRSDEFITCDESIAESHDECFVARYSSTGEQQVSSRLLSNGRGQSG